MTFKSARCLRRFPFLVGFQVNDGMQRNLITVGDDCGRTNLFTFCHDIPPGPHTKVLSIETLETVLQKTTHFISTSTDGIVR